MDTPPPFTFGIVGAGRISTIYSQAIVKSHNASVGGILDICKESADNLAKQFHTSSFYDLDSYLQQKNIQASIICTPPSSHKNIACALLQAGHHVLCEKPLALCIQDGIEMMNTARKYNRKLMMASKFRHVDDIIATKKMLTSEIIGSLHYYENNFSQWIDMSNRWNSKPEFSGGGVLIDNGTHSVDIVRYLLGPIKSVRTRDFSVCKDLKVEDSVELSFVTESDIQGTIQLSWNIPLDRNAYVALYGSKGRLKLNWNESKYQHTDQKEWVSFGKGYDKIEAFKKQVHNFTETILGKMDPLITDTESLASISVIEASYRSLKSGKWENVTKLQL